MRLNYRGENMRVQIDNVEWLREKDLIEEYPCLENYGYKCKKFEKENIYGEKYTDYDRSIKISSLKELLKLKEDVKRDIIIEDPMGGDKYSFRVVIYDDYIE